MPRTNRTDSPSTVRNTLKFSVTVSSQKIDLRNSVHTSCQEYWSRVLRRIIFAILSFCRFAASFKAVSPLFVNKINKKTKWLPKTFRYLSFFNLIL